MLNKVILIGHLGQDPEYKTLSGGNKMVTFSLATSEKWKDKTTGERKEKTEWHRVVVFNEHLVAIAEKYLVKGSKVWIEGQLSTRKWTDKDGIDRYLTEVNLKAFNHTLLMLDKADSSGRTPPDDVYEQQ